MPSYVFSERAFASVIKVGDSARFGINLQTDREAIISTLLNSSRGRTVSLKPYHVTALKSRPCYSIKNYDAHIVLRSISRFLVRRFRVRMPSRDRIVRDVILSLADATPMYVVRRDIKSFYETIPLNGLREKLLQKKGIPKSVKFYIKDFFDTFCSGSTGLPQGIVLSAILAEMAMEDYDKKIRELEGVYRYFRYCDDILLFTNTDPAALSSKLESELPEGMLFNASKSSVHPFVAPVHQQQSAIEFLGYRFARSDAAGKAHPVDVTVSIARGKILRLKSKVAVSLKTYAKDRNFPLLLDRLRFLSGNYRVYRFGVQTIGSTKYIRSGLYYNYRHCGVYTKGVKATPLREQLLDLDRFFHSCVFSKSHPIGGRVSKALNKMEMARVKQISFLRGFEEKRFEKFDPKRISEMKTVWRNV